MSQNNSKSKMNWDLTSYFPEFNGPEMKKFKKELKEDIESIRNEASSLSSLDTNNQEQWEKIFLEYEDLTMRYSHLRSYIECLASADSLNEEHLREEAEMSVLGAEFSKLSSVLLNAVKDTPNEVFDLFTTRDALKDASYYLNRVREESQKRMDPENEILAADLGVDGLDAWGRLYDTVSSKLEFDMEYPEGKKVRLPISQRRSLMEKPDRRTRKAAFEGGNEAWKSIEDVTASALNSIAGTRLTLNRHRGIDHFLDVALFQASISKKTLDAMLEAIYSEIEVPKEILRLKAKTMNREKIAWYDLGAPMDLEFQKKLTWEEAKRLVKNSFSASYPELGTFVQSVFEKNWIDWEPREGKRPGGFCTGSLLTKESRIFMTYNETIGDVLTLAHEAGHAFHSYVMREIRPYSHFYPMTLAESASTFGEMILTEGILEDPSISEAEKTLMLDTEINHGAIYLMDIPVRFEFEKAFYEERQKGEVSVSRLKELMSETQRRIFGDILEDGGEDPYFWASKLHFYITGVTFYNFPYTFGYLLSRGLFAMFKKEGAHFLPKYEEFLRLTGSDTAENVAKRSIGHDLESPEFWVESIHTLKEPLNKLKQLLQKIQ
ncbi:MAG: M3 family oligoendopeptidase [Candidatus Dadabacteria bacterium]|nr:MAG: M3 family oligoendopeptidase [Candidatus Dadabacteria bacterium]TDI99514.1 MAG: M3 family oligoendopeptidase [Candidatus Dadabacteria bacterium]